VVWNKKMLVVRKEVTGDFGHADAHEEPNFEIPSIIQKLLNMCDNRAEAERQLRAVTSCGLAAPDSKSSLAAGHRPEWCPAPDTKESDDWTLPRLEARFTFVHVHDKLYGTAYSVIAGTDIFVDISHAIRLYPGYVTPALLTGPWHPDNPYACYTLARLPVIPPKVLKAARTPHQILEDARRAHVPAVPIFFFVEAPEQPPLQLITAEALHAIMFGLGRWNEIAAKHSWDEITLMGVPPPDCVSSHPDIFDEFPFEDELDELFGNSGQCLMKL
jgi:hypothetical protein